MTFTVTATSTPTWYGHGRQTVVVAGGVLTGAWWPTLSGLIAQTEATGVDRIVLDLRAVSSCDRGALLALVAIRGRRPSRHPCVVDVVGVRTGQFVAALAEEPVRGLHALHALIDELRRPAVVSPFASDGVAGASVPATPS